MLFRLKIIIVVALTVLKIEYALGQPYRNTNFAMPLQFPFNLAGSFAEPRPDHFHSGIDIKTNGKEGALVFAIGDGFVSRIRVSPYGYGKAIYITHPNGYTSVYGHLSKFYGKIEAYIHRMHYEKTASELDILLDSTILPLHKRDTIAYSGNSGGSSAPHLHFEIRNSQTEHPLNPLDFYPASSYTDTIPPQLNHLKILQFPADSFYNPSKKIILPLQTKEGYLSTTNIITISNSNHYCIALEGYDKQDNSTNKNGIKKIELYQDNALVFKYDITEINFEQTNMCNAFVDYDEMMKGNGYFYNCYQLKGNLLPFYTIGNGILKPTQQDSFAHLEINCYDYNDNKTIIKFEIQFTSIINTDSLQNQENNSTTKKYIATTTEDSISNTNFSIKFSKNIFFENVELHLTPTKGNKLSSHYFVGNENTLIPLRNSAKVALQSSVKKKRDKIVIVRQDEQQKESALKTTFDNQTFFANTKNLGTFYLKRDIKQPNISINTITKDSIVVKITDNLSGIESYNGYIDNHWINFYYDAKNDVLLYTPDEYCGKGKHLLKIIVTDNVGNKSTLTHSFTF